MPMVPRPMAETYSLVVRSFQVPVVAIPLLLLVVSPAFWGTGAGTPRASGTCSLSLSGPYRYCRAGLCVRGMLLFQRHTECASPALIYSGWHVPSDTHQKQAQPDSSLFWR